MLTNYCFNVCIMFQRRYLIWWWWWVS